MKTCKTLLIVLIVTATAGARVVVGQEATPIGSNTVITADQLLFDYGRMICAFDGNVSVEDPEVRMTCDKLNVLFDSTNSVKSVTAFGNVKVYQQDRRAESDQAVYMAKKGEIELIGNAKLFRGTDTIMGQKITFWLNDDKMKCVPGKLIIHAAADQGDFDLLPGLPSGSTKKPSDRDNDLDIMEGR